MLTVSDFITLPFPPDLTQAGISYACRSLAYTYNRMGGSRVDRLRRIVSGVAIELGFRRYLNAHGVPHDNLGGTPFTDPDHYDVALGGRRCDLKSYLIFRKSEIQSQRQDPGQLLGAAALVPSDQVISEHLHDHDLYIFAFTHARITQTSFELRRALAAGQPACFVHPLPERWSHPAGWAPLGKLSFDLETAQPGAAVTLELGGQAGDRSFQTEQLELRQGRSFPAAGDYHSLAYLRLGAKPPGRLSVFSPARNERYWIDPRGWGNIWVYGLEILLAGYIPRGEYRQRAQRLPAGSQVLQYARTRTDNLSLPVAELYPLAGLFAQVKAWHSGLQRSSGNLKNR